MLPASMGQTSGHNSVSRGIEKLRRPLDHRRPYEQHVVLEGGWVEHTLEADDLQAHGVGRDPDERPAQRIADEGARDGRRDAPAQQACQQHGEDGLHTEQRRDRDERADGTAERDLMRARPQIDEAAGHGLAGSALHAPQMLRRASPEAGREMPARRGSTILQLTPKLAENSKARLAPMADSPINRTHAQPC